ncbi:MAG: hypothetical protein ACYC6L_10450 [Anaerolineae bacterium]
MVEFVKRSGRSVHSAAITHTQIRAGYHRQAYTAKRGQTIYQVGTAEVKPASQAFRIVVEIPERARNVHFYARRDDLPGLYRSALQDVR